MQSVFVVAHFTNTERARGAWFSQVRLATSNAEWLRGRPYPKSRTIFLRPSVRRHLRSLARLGRTIPARSALGKAKKWTPQCYLAIGPYGADE